MHESLWDSTEMTQTWYKNCVNAREPPSPFCHCFLLYSWCDFCSRKTEAGDDCVFTESAAVDTWPHWPLVTPVWEQSLQSLMHSQATVWLWAQLLPAFSALPRSPLLPSLSWDMMCEPWWPSSCLVCPGFWVQAQGCGVTCYQDTRSLSNVISENLS